MLSCAAIQKLERYGYLGLKRHSTEDFVATSIKDPKRANVYALTLLDMWKEAVRAVRGDAGRHEGSNVADGVTQAPQLHEENTRTAAPARFTDALVYAMSFAVALTTQHLLEVTTAGLHGHQNHSTTPGAAPTSASMLFPDNYAAAVQLLTTVKEMGLAMSSGHVLLSNASSDEFTRAFAHLLTNVLDLVLLLLATHLGPAESLSTADGASHAQMLAQGLVLTASVAQMLRRVQTSYPVPDLYNTRPCAALLKQAASKHKQQQQQQIKQCSSTAAPQVQLKSLAAPSHQHQQPIIDLLRRYVLVCTQAAPSAGTTAAADGASPTTPFVSAASLFSAFSLFQRLSLLHGALAAVVDTHPSPFPFSLCRASEEVQYWLGQLLASTACNRATRYVVYFREDELRLMQHNIRQASEYALYTFTTTPPVDPGLVQSLLGEDHSANHSSPGKNDSKGSVATHCDTVTHARAALVLAQWCVSAPFFFESFCQDESWAAFAQEQRRLVLLQQSRARRGLEKSSKSKNGHRKGAKQGNDCDKEQEQEQEEEASMSRSSSVSSRSSDTASVRSSDDNNNSVLGDADTASLQSFHTSRHSIGGSVTSLASRVSLLSTFSKHSAASYLSFISVLRPSTAGSISGGGGGAGAGEDGGGLLDAGEPQIHESEDGNTNLPLILLEQLTLGLHRFMEAYPVALLDAYGLRSVAWSCIARMFVFVEASLLHTTAVAKSAMAKKNAAAAAATARLPQPLFSLAQDVRYNKGMGYECLGLLFAKVVAPLLDLHHGLPATAEQQQRKGEADAGEKEAVGKRHRDSSDSDDDSRQGALSGNEEAEADVASMDGDRTEEGFFANVAAAATTVGRASLTANDDATTRQHIEAALSTCLTAYEAVAPQVVDMNLSTILRLAARTAASASDCATMDDEAEGERMAGEPTSSWLSLLLQFLQDITRRLGRNNELPHLVDALLGRDGAAGEVGRGVSLVDAAELSSLTALRDVFRLTRVRRALTDAAGMLLDPESLLLHLTSIASELEDGMESANGVKDGNPTTQDTKKDDLVTATHTQRTLLTLEVIEVVLEGVVPTSVSASAVLEQTTQLELLLTSSFMKAVEALSSATADEDGSTSKEQSSSDGVHEEEQQQRRAVIVQHARAIRQCRAVTALCLQDLGSQQVREYLLMLNETLWQLNTDVGQLLGTLTIDELQPLLGDMSTTANDASAEDASSLSSLLLLPSLVLQRLSLTRAVTAALGTTAGPATQLHAMVAYVWSCITGTMDEKDNDVDKRKNNRSDAGRHAKRCRTSGYRSLLLASQMRSEDWISVVTLGKEKHARAAMMALLARSFSPPWWSAEPATSFGRVGGIADAAWLSCCLRCIPGTTLRALVDMYVTLSIDELSDDDDGKAGAPAHLRRWTALLSSLMEAYAVVGHNPYWPSVLMHTVRAIAHLSLVWRKSGRNCSSSSTERPSKTSANLLFSELAGHLLELVLCVVRSEARAVEVLRKALLTQLQESLADSGSNAAHPPALSRTGMSVTYVKAIKVPATALSDFSAPASVAADTDAAALAAQVSALKEISFDDELRELCAKLFHHSFVTQLFSLVDLASASASAAAAASSPTASALTSLCMAVLAFLYQTSLATAQAAWRARLTSGSLEALRNTAAVTFLNAVARTFQTRTQGFTSRTADGDAAVAASSCDAAALLLAFLEPFHAAGDQHLFVHIASQRTTTSMTGTAATDIKAAEGGGALDEVEKCWQCIFCHCARDVVTSMQNGTSKSRRVFAVLLRVFLARLLQSAQHKQRQMSKSRHPSAGAAAAVREAGGKRGRRRNGAGSIITNSNEEETNSEAATGGVEVFLREVLSSSASSHADSIDNSKDGHAEERFDVAHELREQLSEFFGLRTRGDACADCWRSVNDEGDEAAVSAWWLLWKLYSVIMSTAAPEDASRAQSHVKAFVTTSHQPASASVEGAMVALHACSCVLDVLPANAVPPLFFDHLDALLRSVIPDLRGTTSTSATAVGAAADLLLQLFRIRPRLPAWRLLPHAQRLLVWLTHPRSRESPLLAGRLHNTSTDHSGAPPVHESSLSLPGIRLCAAVAAHPLVAASAHTPLTESSSLLSASQPLHELNSMASEALDNVWLLLLSLLQSSGTDLAATAAAAAATTASASVSTKVRDANATALQESEMTQLIVLLTRTWLRSRQQLLWSRPAMLPPVMGALFACVMGGMEASRYSPRVLNVLAGGFAAMAAHVDAATAAESDAAVSNEETDVKKEEEEEDEGAATLGSRAGGRGEGSDATSQASDQCSVKRRGATSTTSEKEREAHTRKRRRTETTARSAAAAAAPTVSAALKRAALTATTAALFEIAQHYVHVFTTYSSDMDFLFTDFLRVLSQHFLPTVTRPPIAYHPGVRIGGTTQSEMTFADLAYMCVGNAESKALLKQAAQRLEEEEGDGGAVALTDGSRSIFHVA